jgi:hypothetical protein
MEMLKKEEQVIVMENASQVAFCSLKKLHITPFVKPDGRVAFSVKGDISKVLSELSENPLIPILDYIQRLDTIRSIIFSMKGKEYNNSKSRDVKDARR